MVFQETLDQLELEITYRINAKVQRKVNFPQMLKNEEQLIPQNLTLMNMLRQNHQHVSISGVLQKQPKH